MSKIEDPTMKLIRAKEHLDALEAELFMFYVQEPTAVSVEKTADKRLNVFRARIAPAPQRLGILAGDAMSSLREALDHLAWQLARNTKDPPFERTEFPIFGIATKNSERRFAEVTQDIPPAAVEALELLQPYHRGAEYKNDPLWQIDKIWNVAKHQVIPTNSHFLEFKAKGAGKFVESRTISQSEYIAVFEVEGSAEVELHPEASSAVTFGSERHEIVVNLGELRTLHKYVAATVFPKFYGFFDV